jgi:hypothetical protein
MIVLSFGMMKSGSTLAFELCKGVLMAAGHPQRRLPDGLVSPGSRINFLTSLTVASLGRLAASVKPGEIIALKTHLGLSSDVFAFLSAPENRQTFKVQLNYRDPREICLSLVDAGASARAAGRPAFAEIETLEQAAHIVSKQLATCRRWGSIPGALHLAYNDVAFAPDAVIARICAQLGLPAPDEAFTRAARRHAFEDAFTQFNKAVRDRYLDELTVRQNEMILATVRGAPRFINSVLAKGDMSFFDYDPGRERARLAAKAG